MAVYLNLNVLTSIIQEFALRHTQVNSVTVANEIDFRATPNLDYPLVNIEPVEANVDGNLVSQGFVITIADIMNTAFEGENNFRLIDGCQRIASDFITYLQNQTDFDASVNIVLNSFEEGGADRSAGVVFRINLVYYRDDSTCILDDIVDVPRGFDIDFEGRTVKFKSWLMHPFIDEYEVTFDGGQNWIPMTKYTYSLSNSEYPINSIGQRLKEGVSPFIDILWNNTIVPEVSN